MSRLGLLLLLHARSRPSGVVRYSPGTPIARAAESGISPANLEEGATLPIAVSANVRILVVGRMAVVLLNRHLAVPVKRD